MKAHTRSALATLAVIVLVIAVLFGTTAWSPPPAEEGATVSTETVQQVEPVPEFALSPELLGAIAGVFLSLGFSYIPGLNELFAELLPVHKRLVMLLLLLTTAVAIMGLTCAGIVQSGLTCDRVGWIQLTWVFLYAAMANQSAYQLTELPPKIQTIAARAKVQQDDLQRVG